MSGGPSRRKSGSWRLLILLPITAFGCLAGTHATEAWLTRFPAGIDLRQRELRELRTLVREHRVRTGHYPSNDEGLASLSSFATRFAVRCEVRWGPPERFHVWSCGNNDSQVEWPLSQAAGGSTRLRDVADLIKLGRVSRAVRSGSQPADLYDFELAVAPNGRAWLISPAGVLSDEFLPIGYENRTGLPETAFASSPREFDRDGRYSVTVDDGVFLYALDGRLYAAQLDADRRERLWHALVALVAAAAAVGLTLAVLRRWQRLAGFTALAGAASLAAYLTLRTPSCEGTFDFSSDSRPVAAHRRLLDSYRGAAVITEATYRRVLAGTKLEPVRPPASAPAAAGRAGASP